MEERYPKEELNFLDYFITLAKHKTAVFLFTLSCAVITAIISLIMPDIFRGEARILPPQQSSMSTQLISQFAGGLSGLAGGILGTAAPQTDLYVGMLQSRTIFDRVIDKFDLMKLYDVDSRVDARKELIDNIRIDADAKSGIITVSVEDKDPKRAADMANAFVDELRNLAKGIAISEAAQRRLFYEEQLKATKLSLTKAEEEMKAFGENTGALQVEEQAKAVIEGIAGLRAQIAAKEVEIKVMRTYSTHSNPDLQQAEEALRGLKGELSKLEVKSGGGHDPLMPTGRMPSVGMEYIRKMRDVKFNEALFELLSKQYEVARLDEAKEAAVIQIIDKAVPLDKKDKPKRALMVIMAAFVGFFFAISAVFITELKEKTLANAENRERYESLKQYISFRRRR